ncbi:hypothetical protein BDAP_000462 [Binucleata daphniae]
MYGPSDKRYTYDDNTDKNRPVLWQTEQKDSNNMVNPQLDNKVDFVDETISLDQDGVVDVIGTAVVGDIVSLKLKRSAEPQEDELINPSTNNETAIPNNEIKPQTFEDIINEFYRVSIEYMWHFFINPRILYTSSYCNSQLNVDTCDLKLEKLTDNNKDNHNLFIAPVSFLQTKTTECMITAFYVDNLHYQALCRLIISDDSLVPFTLDFRKFLYEKKSLVGDERINKHKSIYRKVKNASDIYTTDKHYPDFKIDIDRDNNNFNIFFNFLYKQLAENNSTNQKFEPQNTNIVIYLQMKYATNQLFTIYTIAEEFALAHNLYRKVFLEHNYDQNIKDALKEIEARINATSTTKNEKVHVIMSTLISLAIARLVLQ